MRASRRAPWRYPKVASYQSHYQGARSPIAVGKFDNRSSYMRGIFSDGVDRLGNQAKTVLITHLQQTGRFSVLDRDNMAEIQAEAGIKQQQAQQLKGADYVVTGDVTEFGRKEVGDHQLFGILGRGKSQIAYAKGQPEHRQRHHLGSGLLFPGCRGVRTLQPRDRRLRRHRQLRLHPERQGAGSAIREAVNNLVNGIETGAWRPVQ